MTPVFPSPELTFFSPHGIGETRSFTAVKRASHPFFLPPSVPGFFLCSPLFVYSSLVGGFATSPNSSFGSPPPPPFEGTFSSLVCEWRLHTFLPSPLPLYSLFFSVLYACRISPFLSIRRIQILDPSDLPY